jgi:hypothetical protein
LERWAMLRWMRSLQQVRFPWHLLDLLRAEEWSE